GVVRLASASVPLRPRPAEGCSAMRRRVVRPVRAGYLRIEPGNAGFAAARTWIACHCARRCIAARPVRLESPAPAGVPCPVARVVLVEHRDLDARHQRCVVDDVARAVAADGFADATATPPR